MVSHVWKKLDSFPLYFVIIFSIGIFVPYIIALSNGHVTPHVPYISEGGGTMPEAGIFSVCIALSSFLSQWIMCLRYLVVEEQNTTTNNDMNRFLNKISLALGILSTLAMVVVASYPVTTISQVHNSAAGSACICYVMYLICQTWISFRILGRTNICYWRLAITIATSISLIFVTIFGVLGSTQWTSEDWVGKKTPQDKGFVFYVISATAEWAMAVLLMLYFTTYVSEFKKCSFNFQLEINYGLRIKPRLSNLDIHHP